MLAAFCISERRGLHSTATVLVLIMNSNGSRDRTLSDKPDPSSSKVPPSTTKVPPSTTEAQPQRPLPPAAQRALAEAAARRAEFDRLAAEAAKTRPRELQGPKGPEPTRYGDWEKNGRCIDF